MGAWGTAIFSDDTAQDVRDEWREAVLDGLSAEEATARLVKSFDDYLGDDEDTETLFWMALAAAQFETGRLLAEVRDRALAMIEGGGDVARWREDGDEVLARQRERVLERLAAKLRGPQPKPKRLRRVPSLPVPPFEVGDVVRVYEEDGENEVLVLVVGTSTSPVPTAIPWLPRLTGREVRSRTATLSPASPSLPTTTRPVGRCSLTYTRSQRKRFSARTSAKSSRKA
ncbi:MAG TPA: DUF4259 domain-containing protein [Gaiellaceae bacterium]|nr:DUF4259 domain-containing protein [Gaiellaceae bacterium]